MSDNAEVLSSLSQQLKQLITRADRLQQQHEAILSATNPGAPFHRPLHCQTSDSSKRMVLVRLTIACQKLMPWHRVLKAARWLSIDLSSSAETEKHPARNLLTAELLYAFCLFSDLLKTWGLV